MLALCDDTVKLWRYEITYTIDSESVTEYALSEADRNTILYRYPEATVNNVDQSANEWIEGMEFPNRKIAMEALEMGKEGYEKFLIANDTDANMAELLVDLACRITLIELGVI